MKVLKILVLFGCLVVALIPESSRAQTTPRSGQEMLEQFPTGQVDWTNGYISASGIGVANINLPQSAAQATAKRAAIIVARRNLLELIQGIRVDSETVVENFLVKSDQIQAKVSGLVKGATIENIVEHTHGGVEVTLRMPLRGAASLGLALMSGSENTDKPFITSSAELDDSYTGLTIDARGLRLQPALFPKVIEEDGTVLYSPDTPRRGAIKEHGYIEYQSLSSETLKPIVYRLADFYGIIPIKEKVPVRSRVGRKPLRIKGVKKHGTLKANVIISSRDAENIRQTPSLFNALRNANVVIITDPLIAGIQGKQGKPFLHLVHTISQGSVQ